MDAKCNKNLKYMNKKLGYPSFTLNQDIIALCLLSVSKHIFSCFACSSHRGHSLMFVTSKI